MHDKAKKVKTKDHSTQKKTTVPVSLQKRKKKPENLTSSSPGL